MTLFFSRKFKVYSLLGAFLLFTTTTFSQKHKVWIDADTGNETDDLYALARLLTEPSIEVVGLSSAHFNNADLVTFQKWNQYETKKINTVAISQQLNEELLNILGKSAIFHPLGADKQMGRAWGGQQPRISPASQGIIAEVKKLKDHEKLNVICLGALTNVASAIAVDTSIVDRLTCYALGARYTRADNVWNKNEFNIRNDLNAFDYLLDNKSVDLFIMPVNVAHPFQFKRDSLYAVLSDRIPLEKMLKKRWQETNPQDVIRTLWDLALVEALVVPDYARFEEVSTPPENTQRKIKVYTSIDAQKMAIDFYRQLKAASQN